MNINKRLLAIASLIDEKDIKLADIGCDHAWLSIYLITKNIASKAIACDINKGPLESAIKNINSYDMQEKIICLQSDGLTNLKKDDFDTLVIAGMGGSLIRDILKKGQNKLVNKNLYLQANNNTFRLRTFCLNNNFEIITEYLVKDNVIIY
jgi:tRNA (adenine22-N1)-methyltransferase